MPLQRIIDHFNIGLYTITRLNDYTMIFLKFIRKIISLHAMPKSNFTYLYITNFWGVMNDNFLKTVACFIAISWVDIQWQSLVVSAAAGSLVLPYLIFSPLAARMTSIWSKKRIIIYCKIAEPLIMVVAVIGYMYQSVFIVILSILLMGLQSAIYSPAKYSLIRDIGGNEGISTGMGGMEAVSFMAMLAGMVAASVLVDMVPISTIYICLFAFSILGLIFSFGIKAEETPENNIYPIEPISFITNIHKKALEYKGLNSIIYTLSVFWWIAASMQIGLLIYCKQVLYLNSFDTGLILSLAAVGITIGCVAAGYINKRHPLLWRIPLIGLVLTILFILMFACNLKPIPFTIVLFITAFTAGLFKLPLDTEIQKRVKGSTLNVILAYFNQVSFIFILLASVTFSLLCMFLSPKYLFLMLAIISFCAPIYLMINYKSLICHIFKDLLHLRYDIKISGIEHLQSKNTLLVMPNHQAVVDPMILFAEFYDYQLRPMVDEAYFNTALTRHILGLFDSIEVPDLSKNRKGVEQAKQLRNIALESLKRNWNVFFYPSGHITLDGREHIGNRHLAYETCKELPENTTVIGIRTYGLWGSMWSKYKKKKTPNLAFNLFKSIMLILFGIVFVMKRRPVTIKIEIITDKVIEWAKADKKSFNTQLENYYNTPI